MLLLPAVLSVTRVELCCSVESDAWQPAGLRKGWEVSHCLSTPLLAAHEDDDKVQFGEI